MPTELLVNTFPGQSVSLAADVTTAPAAGTAEVWSVSVPSGFTLPAIGASSGQMRGVVDSEIVIIYAGVVTAGTQSWSVTRGAEGSTVATHTGGPVIYLSDTAGTFANMVQLSPSAVQGGSLWLNGAKNLFVAAPDATAAYGVLNIGSGPFDGSSAGHFAGSTSGTGLAFNFATGYAGRALDVQVNGVSQLGVSANGRLLGSKLVVDLKGAAFANPIVLDGVTPNQFIYFDTTFSSLRIGGQGASGPAFLDFDMPSGIGYQDIMQLTSTSLAPSTGVDNTVNLGVTGQRWKSLWIGTGQAEFDGNVLVKAASATTIPAVLKGAASQTSDLQQWQDSAAHTQFGIMNAGTGAAPIWALRVRATANAESMAQAHAIGAATGKAIQVFDDAGTSLGWLALYA